MAILDSKVPEGPIKDKWTNYKNKVDLVNPAIARKLLAKLTSYQCFNKETVEGMKEALLWLKNQKLSDELSEVVERGL